MTTQRTRPLSSTNAPTEANLLPRRNVLILGGWSPGPLESLEASLAHRGCTLVRPRIEMPPMTCGWCCHWHFAGIMAGGSLVLWALGCLVRQPIRQAYGVAWYSLWLFAVVLPTTLLCLRLLVASAVHTAMQANVRLCRNILAAQEICLVIGFSWGGAVAAEVLAQPFPGAGTAAVPLPPMLLLAPTTAVVASLNLWNPRDAAWRAPASAQVVVVHATADPVFCPHAERWPAATLHRLRDNHVLLRPSSERALLEILNRLLLAG